MDKHLDCARTMPTPLSAIAFQQLHREPDPLGQHSVFPCYGRECRDAMQPFVDREVYVKSMEDAGGKSEQPVLRR